MTSFLPWPRRIQLLFLIMQRYTSSSLLYHGHIVIFSATHFVPVWTLVFVIKCDGDKPLLCEYLIIAIGLLNCKTNCNIGYQIELRLHRLDLIAALIQKTTTFISYYVTICLVEYCNMTILLLFYSTHKVLVWTLCICYINTFVFTSINCIIFE